MRRKVTKTKVRMREARKVLGAMVTLMRETFVFTDTSGCIDCHMGVVRGTNEQPAPRI